MPSPTEITVAQLSRLVGLPGAPALVDVRTDHEFKADPRIIPTAQRHDSRERELGKPLCRPGHHRRLSKRRTYSHGTASWLRHKGLDAQTLEGGFEAWKKEGGVLVRADKVPLRNGEGRTVWVTRARPKVVRIACPWLVRRFVDPKAVFLFVPPAEVLGVAEHMQGNAVRCSTARCGTIAETSAHSTLWSRSSVSQPTRSRGWRLCAERIPDGWT